MITLKLNIKSISDKSILDDYIYAYTGMFYYLYKHKNNNPDYIANMKNNSLLDISMIDYCIKDVETKLKQRDTSINQKKILISDIEYELAKSTFSTKKDKKRKYKLLNKLRYIKRTLNNNITFGGKALLREITALSQLKDKTESQLKSLEDKKLEYKNKRKLSLYLIGRACEKGNRKVSFDLTNNKVTFKPNRDTKVLIEFNSSNNYSKILAKLQEYSDNKRIPLTVRISSDNLYIIYDEELLNGYSFNEIECKKEQSNHISKENKKQVYINYKNEQNERKSLNKIVNRYCSVDLNPSYIGYSIFDYKDDKQVLIHKECIDLSKLNHKRGLSSDSSKSKYINNKRKTEICEIWKHIFVKCKHYKVYNFVMEDLEFKSTVNNDNKEFNRLTKNVWHRTLTTNLITKYCNILGINKIEVNPCYSSFIGNMVYEYYDPISSSMEIGRRGIFKYKKGYSIYPSIETINLKKLNYLLGENVIEEGLTWKELYNMISLLRYRNPKKLGLRVKYLHKKSSMISLISE